MGAAHGKTAQSEAVSVSAEVKFDGDPEIPPGQEPPAREDDGPFQLNKDHLPALLKLCETVNKADLLRLNRWPAEVNSRTDTVAWLARWGPSLILPLIHDWRCTELMAFAAAVPPLRVALWEIVEERRKAEYVYDQDIIVKAVEVDDIGYTLWLERNGKLGAPPCDGVFQSLGSKVRSALMTEWVLLRWLSGVLSKQSVARQFAEQSLSHAPLPAVRAAVRILGIPEQLPFGVQLLGACVVRAEVRDWLVARCQLPDPWARVVWDTHPMTQLEYLVKDAAVCGHQQSSAEGLRFLDRSYDLSQRPGMCLGWVVGKALDTDGGNTAVLDWYVERFGEQAVQRARGTLLALMDAQYPYLFTGVAEFRWAFQHFRYMPSEVSLQALGKLSWNSNVCAYLDVLDEFVPGRVTRDDARVLLSGCVCHSNFGGAQSVWRRCGLTTSDARALELLNAQHLLGRVDYEKALQTAKWLCSAEVGFTEKELQDAAAENEAIRLALVCLNSR